MVQYPSVILGNISLTILTFLYRYLINLITLNRNNMKATDSLNAKIASSASSPPTSVDAFEIPTDPNVLIYDQYGDRDVRQHSRYPNRFRHG